MPASGIMVVTTDCQSTQIFSRKMNSTPKTANEIPWQSLGAELVFTQDLIGQYLSFYWQNAQDYGLLPEQVINISPQDNNFVPDSMDAYLKCIERVIARRIPEQCHWYFKIYEQNILFELIISPILPPEGEVTSVLVMGSQLGNIDIAAANTTLLPTSPDPYQKLLTQIAGKIRRTLDLETIWHQTVNSLGEALNVSRCLIISDDRDRKKLKVEAEYCRQACQSMLGMQLDLDSEPHLKQALACRDVVVVDMLNDQRFNQKSTLVVSTFHQSQRNALICLQQCDRRRCWNPAEVALVQELSEQVGTAIAHAKLYQELEQASKKAEEASRLKSEFLASTSHELRTPLNGIIGFLNLILEDMADDPEEQQEFLQEAHKSALHLLNLINDILDIAKIEAGKMELNFTDVQLAELFQDVEKKTRTQAFQKKLSFDIKLPSTLEPVLVYGNYQRLLQVMINLVGNAIKFTHEGGITVTAEVVKKKLRANNQDFPGLVKVRVADTGIGVSLDKQDRLFQKFSQVDGSRTKSYGGTGLGLVISKVMVEAMGGEVNFFSMGEGLGSTVTFTIPLFQMPVTKTSGTGDE